MSESIGGRANQTSQEYEVDFLLIQWTMTFIYILKNQWILHTNHFYLSEMDILILLLEIQVLLTLTVLPLPVLFMWNSKQMKRFPCYCLYKFKLNHGLNFIPYSWKSHFNHILINSKCDTWKSISSLNVWKKIL
jgi:hypothetical protein